MLPTELSTMSCSILLTSIIPSSRSAKTRPTSSNTSMLEPTKLVGVCWAQNCICIVPFHANIILITAYSLPGYADLARELDSNSDTPTFVSLGSDGYYFAVTENNFLWKLPDPAAETVRSSSGGDNPVVKVWLGKDESYVVQKQDGTKNWNLRGNYGSLDQTLKYATGIKVMGLNLQHDRSYFVVFRDGHTQCNPIGTRLTERAFKDWAARF